MKRRLYIPIITLGLSAVLLASTTQQVQAHHGRTQQIAPSQNYSGYGRHHASIHVNESWHHPDEHTYNNYTPVRGAYQPINSGSLPAASQANTAVPENYITESQARSIALEHAGVREADVIYLYSTLDTDDGVLEYEVEFCTGTQQYDYEIKAADGTVLSYDYEIEGGHHHTMSGNSITPPAGYISEADAKKTALEHAGVQESDITFFKIKLEYDDGVLEYEVEFYAGNKEYDYDIDAATGVIRSYDYEIEEDFNTSGSDSSSATVTEAEAKKMVLDRIPGATEANIRDFETDRDDGRIIYEGEVKYGGMEYEFEIDAATGAFREWDVDEDD